MIFGDGFISINFLVIVQTNNLINFRVTDNILAMARPNYTEMKKHNMIDSFKK